MPDLHVISEETIKLAVELTQMHGFVCLPTADKVPLAKGWQQFGESYKGERWSLAKGVGIQTGSRSGITVVDIDEPDTEFFEKFMKHFDIKPTTWVVTPGNGYHLYFKYNGDLPNGNFEPIKWDIRNDGGYIMAPGSYYTNPKKPHMNFKKYTFKTLEDGTELDWEYIRDLDEEFLKVKLYGIDQETMKFGKKVLKKEYKSKEIVKKKETDDNKVLFMGLMMAYAKAKGTGYQEWLYGVWAICHVCKEFGWDPQKFAIAWSEQIGGYKGPTAVIKKVRQHSRDKGSYTLQWVLGQVPEEARVAFSKFKRKFKYNDYQYLFRAPTMDITLVEQYIRDSFVRVDRMSNVMWYGKALDGTWVPIKQPFSKDNQCSYSYEIANPKYRPNDVKCKASEFIVVSTTLGKTIAKQSLRWVPNYSELQYLPHHGVADPTPEGTFNSFTGYRHKILPTCEYDEEDEGLLFILNHWFKYLCNGNKEFYEYLMSWLAWQLRYGWKKIKTAIVMFGIQGIGKSLLWNYLIWKGVVGERNVNVCHSLKKFTGQFNMARLDNVLHIFDECTSIKGDSKVNWDTMKAVITDKDFMAEPKYGEQFKAVDCAGCVLLSNHSRCVDIPNDDRRYAIIETSKEKPPPAYFTKLADYVHDVRVQRTFFTFLMHRDLSGYNWRDIPQTESRTGAQNARGENRVLDYLNCLVMDRIDYSYLGRWFDAKHNEVTLKKSERYYDLQRIYDDYRKYLEKIGVNQKYIPTRESMVNDLKTHGLSVKYVLDRSFSWYDNWKNSKKQRRCCQIDKAIVRDINRSKRNNPNWDYE